MNKKLINIAIFCTLLLCLVSCSSNNNLNDNEIMYSTPSNYGVEYIEETEENQKISVDDKSEENEITVQNTTDENCDERGYLLWTAPDGEKLYSEDALIDDTIYKFDKAYYRASNGVYYDNIANPELFDLKTGIFKGDSITVSENEFISIKNNTTYNEYHVKCSEEFSVNSYEHLSNNIAFEDLVTLSGTVIYSEEFHNPTYSEGDIWFIPNSSYIKMPNAYLSYLRGYDCIAPLTIVDGFFMVYCDTPFIYLGNINTEYKDNREIQSFFNDTIYSNTIGEKDGVVLARAKASVDNLIICDRNFLGLYSNSGQIKCIDIIQ